MDEKLLSPPDEVPRENVPVREQCKGITLRGTRCKAATALYGGYCHQHRPADHAFDPTRAAQLIALLRAGNRPETSARAAGVPQPTFIAWQRDEPEFRRELEQARAMAEARHVTQVASAAGDDWHAATYMLDRQLGPLPSSEELDLALAEEVKAAAQAEAVSTLEAIGEDPELSRGAIERYVTSVVAWKMLEAEWERLGRPGTTLGGATGYGQVAHPLITQIAAARRESAQLASVLGLDPRSRAILARRVHSGRPPGAASAADRQPPRRRLRAVQ